MLLVFRLVDTFLSRSAPFVSLDASLIPHITKLLRLSSSDILYDLGSGNAQVLVGLAKTCPKASYIGLDIGFIPTMLARRNVKKAGLGGKIKILRANFLRQDLSAATRVFTYLFPGLMDELLPKLKTELPKGALLVSCDYSFSDKRPAKVVLLKRDTSQRCHTLYLYKF